MTTLRIAGGRLLRPDMTVERGDVLVDDEEGVILEIGDVAEGDETLDASGGLVIPGLVNAHTHAAMTLLRGYADDKPLGPWLREDIWPAEAAFTPEDVRAGTELALVEMIRSGTTGFADMYFHEGEVVEAVADAGLRAVLGHGIVTVGKDEADAVEDLETGLAVAKQYDGAADGRVTTALMPHSLTTVGEEYLREYVERAREAGVRVHYHANETREEVDPVVDERGERPLAYARDVGMTAAEDFIAHAVHVDDEEMRLLAETGTAAVHCPASNMKLASGMAPIQAMLDAGVTVGLGTDGAASNNDLDMFDEMRDAAMVGKLAAGDASAVAVPDVVRMATAGSNAALGWNGGRVEEGANADLAVVDLDAPHLTPEHDLVSLLVYAATGSDVRHTVAAGRVLMADREVRTLDEDAVISRAADRAADLVARVE